MKKIILIALLNILSVYAIAQNLKVALVKGNLLDQSTKQPIGYATVSIRNLENKLIAGVITSEKGDFIVDSIPMGNYTIQFQFIGYKTLSKSLVIQSVTPVNLGQNLMEQDATQLNDVVIQGSAPAVSLKLDKKTFLVGKDVLSQNGSINDVLSGVPSVSVSPTGAVSLRGNSNVNLLINGRKTGLTEGGNLEQIPADQIEKIEVITNPSARYDAAGSAGIINIVLKKNKKEGFNGQLKLMGGWPNDARILPSINYKSNSVNFFSTFGYRNSDYLGHYTTNQQSSRKETSAQTDINQKENRHDDGKNLYLGADFFLNDKNSITAAFFKNYTHDSDSIRLDYDYKNTLNQLDSTLLRKGTSSERRNYNQLELNYTRNFINPNKKWTVDLLYDFWNSDKDWNFVTRKLSPTSIYYPAIRTNSNGSSKDLLVQSDLVLPLAKKVTLEMGLKGESRSVNSDFLAEELRGNTWTVFNNIDNQLNYSEKIASGYFQVAKSFKKLSLMLGLRTELTNIKIEDLKGTYNNEKQYAKLFPSFSTNYELKENSTLQFTYSKRINRPSLSLLFPFNELTDLNSQFIGNPALNPAYADVIELGYLKRWTKLTFNPSIYYQYTNSPIQDFSFRNADGLMITTPVNIKSEIRKGIELSLLYSPSKWMQINSELNAFRFEQRGNFQQVNIYYSSNTLTSRTSLQFKLPKQFSFQARYNFTGPQRNAQSEVKSIHFIDIGASKSLFNDSINLTLDGTNILDSKKTRRTTITDGYISNEMINFNATRYRLSLTYRFNPKAKQAVRQAKSGNRG